MNDTFILVNNGRYSKSMSGDFEWSNDSAKLLWIGKKLEKAVSST